MPKDPKTKAELSYESLSACLASAKSVEGAMQCQEYFNAQGTPTAPKKSPGKAGY